METLPITLSVVIPVYNEEAVIPMSFSHIYSVLSDLQVSFEIIFVNDGSSDKSRFLIESLAQHHNEVRLINFSRNFGHQSAITAGLRYAKGEAIVMMDADLQDPPELIPSMIQKWKNGYDIVYAKRISRIGENWFKKATAALFYRTLSFFADVKIPVDVGDFRLIDRKVCDVLNQFNERHRYLRGLSVWVGFKQGDVPFIRQKRAEGNTKFSLYKMIQFALDAISSFSIKPLRLAAYIGFILSFIGFVYLGVVLYEKMVTGQTIQGWASLVSILLVSHGIMFIILGIMGEYIGRIYEEVKNRPHYIVESTIGIDSLAHG